MWITLLRYLRAVAVAGVIFGSVLLMPIAVIIAGLMEAWRKERGEFHGSHVWKDDDR